MHPFPPGTKVETNEEYFRKFERKVKGVSLGVEGSNAFMPDVITLVRWDEQEGQTIPDHQGCPVIMYTEDLRRVTQEKEGM